MTAAYNDSAEEVIGLLLGGHTRKNVIAFSNESKLVRSGKISAVRNLKDPLRRINREMQLNEREYEVS